MYPSGRTGYGKTYTQHCVDGKRDCGVRTGVGTAHGDRRSGTAAEAVGFDPKPTVHCLRHRWFTNAARSGVPGYIADAIVGHGNKKKSLRSLYLTLSDEDPIKAVDMMKFDNGETEIRVKR